MTEDEANNKARIENTIKRIQEVCEANKTSLQSFIGEIRGPGGVLMGTAAQVRVVLNDDKEEKEDAGTEQA